MAHDPDDRLLPGLGRVARLIGRTAVEMTLPVALLVAAGAIRALRQKRIEALWLIPPLGLFLIFAVSAFRDQMTIKPGYTTTFGLLLIPFVACALDWLGVERWSRARCLAAAALLFAAVGICMYEPAMRLLPGGSHLSANPVPEIPDVGSVRKLQDLIERADLRRENDALVSDDFGLLTTPYVSWQTRLHPGRICRTPGAANVHLSPEQLRVFLLRNRSGVLIARPDSRLAGHLALQSAQAGTLAGIPLRLEPVGSMHWDSKDPKRQFGTLTVSRFQVVGMDNVPIPEPLLCTNACPIALCRHPSVRQP